MARSLDIPERQIAIDHWDDEQGFFWHHRVLLVGAGNGKWIWATPDFEVQFHDLSTHQVVPIPRNSAFPERVTGGRYWCTQHRGPWMYKARKPSSGQPSS